MKKISEYIKWYFYITTSILIVTAVIFTLYGAKTLPGATLWQILLSGLLTTLITVAIGFVNCKSTVGTVLKYFCHYIALSGVMIFCGNWFGWLALDFAGIAMMMGAVATVYALAFGAYCVIDLRAAKKINERLKEKYGDY